MMQCMLLIREGEVRREGLWRFGWVETLYQYSNVKLRVLKRK
jgi:hypothetical protein